MNTSVKIAAFAFSPPPSLPSSPPPSPSPSPSLIPFNPELHPRGPNGQFIDANNIIEGLAQISRASGIHPLQIGDVIREAKEAIKSGHPIGEVWGAAKAAIHNLAEATIPQSPQSSQNLQSSQTNAISAVKAHLASLALSHNPPQHVAEEAHQRAESLITQGKDPQGVQDHLSTYIKLAGHEKAIADRVSQPYQPPPLPQPHEHGPDITVEEQHPGLFVVRYKGVRIGAISTMRGLGVIPEGDKRFDVGSIAEGVQFLKHNVGAGLEHSFAPRPPPLLPPSAPAQSIPAGFPSPDKLNSLIGVRSLGGSTGALLVEDPQTGSRFVMKRGSHPEHIISEDNADRIYRSLGISVPNSHLYQSPEGPIKLSEFLPYPTLEEWLPKASPKQQATFRANLQKGFAADALLDNWDVIGMSEDNILVGPNSTPIRIDNGGALSYRAMGSPKNERWNPYATALWDMPEKLNQGDNPFHSLSYDARLNQAASLTLKRDQILSAIPDSPDRQILAERLDNLQRVVRTNNAMQPEGWNESYRQEIGRHQTGLGAAGVLDELPPELIPGEGSGLYTPQGWRWGTLRSVGTTSVVSRTASYMESKGGNWQHITEFASGLANCSTDPEAMAMRYYLATQLSSKPKTSFSWPESFSEHRAAFKEQEPNYPKSAQIFHALQIETLSRVKIPGVDQARGTIKLIRTEERKRLAPLEASHGSTIQIPNSMALASASIRAPIYVEAEDKGSGLVTIREIPIHRTFGFFGFEQVPRSNNPFFYTDSEYEVPMIPLPQDNVQIHDEEVGPYQGEE